MRYCLSVLFCLVHLVGMRAQGLQTIPAKTLFNYKSEKTNGSIYSIDNSFLKSIYQDRPATLRIAQKLQSHELQLDYKRLYPYSEDFSIHTASENEVLFSPPLVYAASNTDDYLSTLHVAPDDVSLRIYNSVGNFSMIKKSSDKFELIKEENTNYVEGDCGTSTMKSYTKSIKRTKSVDNLPITKVYLEVDYYTYMDFNQDKKEIIKWLTAQFTEVVAIYAIHNIPLQLQEIFIWDIPDIYGENAINATHQLFTNRLQTNFNGNIAQLVTTKNLGGGVAYLSNSCEQYSTDPLSGPFSVAARMEKTYPELNSNYSWNIYVMAHEIGHTLGSPHTHDCVWGPNNDSAIDNCKLVYNGCNNGSTPTNGGTIMSYCNKTSSGINFALGLGEEPAQLIKDILASLDCIDAPVTDISCTIGEPCNDNNDCTYNDSYHDGCDCYGSLIDINENLLCDLLEECADEEYISWITFENNEKVLAKRMIVSTALAPSDVNIIFSAGQEIILNQGFEVPVGASFESMISGCNMDSILLTGY